MELLPTVRYSLSRDAEMHERSSEPPQTLAGTQEQRLETHKARILEARYDLLWQASGHDRRRWEGA
jgi:hypothetical protein